MEKVVRVPGPYIPSLAILTATFTNRPTRGLTRLGQRGIQPALGVLHYLCLSRLAIICMPFEPLSLNYDVCPWGSVLTSKNSVD